MRLWPTTLSLWSIALALAASLAFSEGAALAQKKGKGKPAPAATSGDDAGDDAAPGKKRKKKQRVFDFGAFGIEGSMKTPQLLYFLGRVKQELDRASLEKRSFMPELTRSVDEGGL